MTEPVVARTGDVFGGVAVEALEGGGAGEEDREEREEEREEAVQHGGAGEDWRHSPDAGELTQDRCD